MRRAEVPGSIVGMVEVELLAGKDLVSAAGASHETGCHHWGEHLASTLVVSAVAAGGRGALVLHVPARCARAALRFSRRRSTFCLSRSA